MALVLLYYYVWVLKYYENDPQAVGVCFHPVPFYARFFLSHRKLSCKPAIYHSRAIWLDILIFPPLKFLLKEKNTRGARLFSPFSKDP